MKVWQGNEREADRSGQARPRGATMTGLGLLILSLTAGVALSADWEAWRGPSANGVSDEAGWNARALDGKTRVAWRADVGMGHSTVAVRGDRLYTMGEREVTAGGKSAREEVIYCLNATTGKEIWSYAYPTEKQEWPGPGSTPVLEGDRLYTVGRLGLVLSLDAAKGTVYWRRDLVAEKLAEAPHWGFCASPLIVGNTVVLNAGSAGLALDKRTGKVLWQSEADGGGLATPLLLEQGRRRLVAIGAANEIVTVDIADGAVVWRHPWRSDADPTLVDQKLHLMGAGRGNGSALLDIGDGEPSLVWESDALSGAFQTSVVIDGYAYGLGRARRSHWLQCVDMATGEIKWSHDPGDWGSLMAADSKLIVIEGDGDLVIVDANPEAYRPISSAKLFSLKDWRSYPRNEPDACWTAPVLANGRIFVRTTYGQLAAVDVRS